MRFAWLLGVFCFGVCADEPGTARQQELENMLKHDCGSCHGLPPKGGLGPSLMPDALAGKSDTLLFDAIRNGRAGTAMPSWRPFLNDAEIRWMVGRLRQR
ncbi:cytochrome C55X precursor NirC [Methylomonas koyamae]|uniref:Cytochrome C55X NirC n=1 Tax=Methylomonas koyamae TaxID=702114 RepID=A0A177MZZ9_9GAMM|nr:cytochrome c [Methylomonas koyamae]OAI10863.1 cytochrome C55X precursor NirC [Methylomonas koyamae]